MCIRDSGYIAERLKGLETELALECRITLNGKERWVRNVVIRGDRKSTRLNSSHSGESRMPSSA